MGVKSSAKDGTILTPGSEAWVKSFAADGTPLSAQTGYGRTPGQAPGGGGGGGVAPDASGASLTTTSIYKAYWDFTPDADFVLAGLRIPGEHVYVATGYYFQVFRRSDQVSLGDSGQVDTQIGVDAEGTFAAPITLSAGVTYRMGIYRASTGAAFDIGGWDAEVSYDGFVTAVGVYYNATLPRNRYPGNGPFGNMWSPLVLLPG